MTKFSNNNRLLEKSKLFMTAIQESLLALDKKITDLRDKVDKHSKILKTHELQVDN